MENTLTKKELEDYLALFCKITDSFDVEKNLWDENDSLMAFRDTIVHVNLWRRLLIITYILMSHKGIVPEMHYFPNEEIAFSQKYNPHFKVHENRQLYCTDESYTKIFVTLLESYGWEQPVDYTWGIYQEHKVLEKNERLKNYVREVLAGMYDIPYNEIIYEMDLSYKELWEECPPELEKFFSDNGDVTLDELENLSEEQLKRLDTIFKNYAMSCYYDNLVETYADAFCMMAFHNPKLDVVNNIRKEMTENSAGEPSVEYSQMCADYDRISTLVSYIVGGFYYMPIEENVRIEEQKYIYTRVYSFKTTDFRQYDCMDLFVLAQPCMIFAIPLLDIQMDEFIQKWKK